ncbi:MAG: hypothetical protein N2689_02170 [Verrucomicrobiae bacterium]|nr:hypothetical protein [Verrucomicrobiae bacterium]
MNRIVVPLGVLLALIGVGLTWAATSKNSKLTSELQQVQQELNNLQSRQPIYARVRQVVQDFVQYGQVQPALDPLLIKYGLKAPAAPAAAAPQPAAQPPRPATTTPRPAKGGTSESGRQ